VAAYNHSHTNMVTGSGLTANYFVVGGGSSAIAISSMKPTTSSTTWSTTSDVNVPTMKAISSYVTGLGYTTNTGTVTSVTITQGTGITVSDSGTAITTSGTRTISLNMASATALGGVKVGEGLSIVAASGVLSIDSTGADEGEYLQRGTDGFEWSTPANYYHTTGSWNGLTYTATANGGAGALAFTIPTGTTSTTVARGDHTHTNMVTGSGLTANYFAVGNGNSAIKISSM